MRLKMDLEGVASAWQAVGGSIFTCEPQPGLALDLAGIFGSMYSDCRYPAFDAQAVTMAVMPTSELMTDVWSPAAASNTALPGSGGCNSQPAWFPQEQQAESLQQLQQVSGALLQVGLLKGSPDTGEGSAAPVAVPVGPLAAGSAACKGHCRPAAANPVRSVRQRLAAPLPATASNAVQPSGAGAVCVEALAKPQAEEGMPRPQQQGQPRLRKVSTDKRPRVWGRCVSSSVGCGVTGLGTLGALPGAAMDGEQLWLQQFDCFDGTLFVGVDAGDEPSDVSDCDTDLLMVG